MHEDNFKDWSWRVKNRKNSYSSDRSDHIISELPLPPTVHPFGSYCLFNNLRLPNTNQTEKKQVKRKEQTQEINRAEGNKETNKATVKPQERETATGSQGKDIEHSVEQRTKTTAQMVWRVISLMMTLETRRFQRTPLTWCDSKRISQALVWLACVFVDGYSMSLVLDHLPGLTLQWVLSTGEGREEKDGGWIKKGI